MNFKSLILCCKNVFHSVILVYLSFINPHGCAMMMSYDFGLLFQVEITRGGEIPIV